LTELQQFGAELAGSIDTDTAALELVPVIAPWLAHVYFVLQTMEQED
jgi:hypothetical protein